MVKNDEFFLTEVFCSSGGFQSSLVETTIQSSLVQKRHTSITEMGQHFSSLGSSKHAPPVGISIRFGSTRAACYGRPLRHMKHVKLYWHRTMATHTTVTAATFTPAVIRISKKCQTEERIKIHSIVHHHTANKLFIIAYIVASIFSSN